MLADRPCGCQARPCRYRHAKRGRTPTAQTRHPPPGFGTRALCPGSVGSESRISRQHHGATTPHGHLQRWEPRTLYTRRRAERSRDRSLLAAIRRGTSSTKGCGSSTGVRAARVRSATSKWSTKRRMASFIPSNTHSRMAKSAYLEVSTTRPETILGDTAVAVHPDDRVINT